MKTELSEKLFQHANTLFPGGVNSPVRAFKGVGGTPRFMTGGNGAHIRDVDGREILDFCMAFGPLILGHGNRGVRDAAVIDGAGEARILFNVFLPINWGITWALTITTFIAAWNAFFWPFIITTAENMMTIPVGITQVNDAFGVQYARTMAVAVLAGLPVVVAYLAFQNRVTEGIMATAGLKG